MLEYSIIEGTGQSMQFGMEHKQIWSRMSQTQDKDVSPKPEIDGFCPVLACTGFDCFLADCDQKSEADLHNLQHPANYLQSKSWKKPFCRHI
jgi:hypothetical protein